MSLWKKKAYNVIGYTRGCGNLCYSSSDAYTLEQGGTQMKFKDIPFNETTMPKGIQALIKFSNYELSIVKNSSSYGNAQGLYEIAVFKGNDQVELPGITEQGDTVKGFLSEGDVMGIIKKMHLVSGADPEVA